MSVGVICGIHLITAMAQQVKTVTVTNGTTITTMTSIATAITAVTTITAVGEDWGGMHHRLGHKGSGLGDQGDWNSSGHLNGHWSGHSDWHWARHSVGLGHGNGVGLGNALDDGSGHGHEVVHLTAILGGCDWGVDGLGVRGQQGGWLVHHWTMAITMTISGTDWTISVSITVGVGGGDREDGGENEEFHFENAKCLRCCLLKQ